MEPRAFRTRRPVIYDEEDTLLSSTNKDMASTPSSLTPAKGIAPSSEEQTPSVEREPILAPTEFEVNAKPRSGFVEPEDQEMEDTTPECEESDSNDEIKDDDDESEDDNNVNPDQRWTFLLEAAAKNVTVQVGHSLLSNRYIVERYGSDVAGALRSEWVIPETTLKSIPTLLATAKPMKREIKSEDGYLIPKRTKTIALPDTLPQVFAGLLRWLQCKVISPPQYVPMKAWKDYYAPILPEDVAMAVCEFGTIFGIKQFHNCGIDMLGDLFNFHALGSSISSLARKVAARKGVEKCVSKMLIMLWALHDLQIKSTHMRHLDECEASVMRAYIEQHHKVMKRNEKVPWAQVKKWRHPVLKDYYL